MTDPEARIEKPTPAMQDVHHTQLDTGYAPLYSTDPDDDVLEEGVWGDYTCTRVPDQIREALLEAIGMEGRRRGDAPPPA